MTFAEFILALFVLALTYRLLKPVQSKLEDWLLWFFSGKWRSDGWVIDVKADPNKEKNRREK